MRTLPRLAALRAGASGYLLKTMPFDAIGDRYDEAFPHKDGKGFNLKLDYLPLNGAEIVARESSDDQAQGNGGAQ